jgi:hypothetical protein
MARALVQPPVEKAVMRGTVSKQTVTARVKSILKCWHMVSSFKPIEEFGSAFTVPGDNALGGEFLRIASGSGLSNFFTRADLITTRLPRRVGPDDTTDAIWAS